MALMIITNVAKTKQLTRLLVMTAKCFAKNICHDFNPFLASIVLIPLCFWTFKNSWSCKVAKLPQNEKIKTELTMFKIQAEFSFLTTITFDIPQAKFKTSKTRIKQILTIKKDFFIKILFNEYL
ncbi:hypothetical protein SCLARK_001065 [Spiroplasma clarkii]|nr:hypothetical protein SCLARK_001065 [Spiroplasma clarkii]